MQQLRSWKAWVVVYSLVILLNTKCNLFWKIKKPSHLVFKIFLLCFVRDFFPCSLQCQRHNSDISEQKSNFTFIYLKGIKKRKENGKTPMEMPFCTKHNLGINSVVTRAQKGQLLQYRYSQVVASRSNPSQAGCMFCGQSVYIYEK